MPGALNEHDRFLAARMLSVAASSEPMQLRDIAVALRVDPRAHKRLVRIAQRELSRSVGAGNWREARAEAEAALRSRRSR